MSGDEMKPLSARDRRYSVINVKWSSTLLKEEGEPSTLTEQGETSTMAEVYTDKGEPSTSTLTDQDEPSTWPGPSGTEDTFVQAIDQVGSCKLFIFPNNENLMMELKFVVLLSQSLKLFKVCATCKKPDVLVEMKEFGTMVQVEMTCNNKICPGGNKVWKSQSLMPGTLDCPRNKK
ncbi:Hypothetical predicted protein [Paramuricea clavata]|uniref:Uncharacterized protein n=1 Tax=Paramuricea clavata TaxID=317549 RepID=A0A6S7H3L5_PARCT|nr:Hypothetical predicted protein [Paramuricea clavata]